MAWTLAFFLCISFMVPVVLGLALGDDTGPSAMIGFLLGPFALLGLFIWGVFRLESRLGYSELTQLFQVPELGWATAALTWANLALLASTMLIAMGRGGIWSEWLCLVAATLSYLPVRLFVFFFRSTEPRELLLLLITFGHFLIRLLLAAP
jgi:hypothetical protein